MDDLSVLMSSVRLHSPHLRLAQLAAPWGVEVPRLNLPTMYSFHSGGAVFEVPEENESFRVSAGDIVLLPHGHAHRIRDLAGSPCVPVERVAMRDMKPNDVLPQAADAPGQTRFVSSVHQIEGGNTRTFKRLLPPVVHVQGRNGEPPEWYQRLLAIAAAESGRSAPGLDAVVQRFSDIYFIQLVREYLAQLARDTGSQAAVSRFPRIAAVLMQVRARLDADWTLVRLARAAGMSRTNFAVAFHDVMGEPPIQYLTRLRMVEARRLLESGGPSVAQVAYQVGYGSEHAFARAFRRHHAMLPSVCRRRAADDAPALSAVRSRMAAAAG
ncbi:MAG: cupin domain-containing protein [Gammaproteobacteria bacterium]